MAIETDAQLAAQLPLTLRRTDFPTLGDRYQGKVRDTYARGAQLVLITTDRLSAFDHVLTTLPFKGDLLNALSHWWFQKTAHVVKNHVIDRPDPCVTVAHRTMPFAIEFVVRGYLTGSLWRDYSAGKDPYALKLPPGLQRDSAFPSPILTPSTKAPAGEHDAPLSTGEVVSRGLLSHRDWDRAAEAAVALFHEGERVAAAQGLILVDTKYEFGTVGDALLLIDEVHTPDSSRYWEAAPYAERFAAGQPQVMLDKENLRQWLIEERGFSGHGPLPAIPDGKRCELAATYVKAFERITGTAFSLKVGDMQQRLADNLARAGLL
jgi:phosphoribosylaminoimidazole-succinocarboxamide synthase